ncbi:hypothetical protein ABOZ73_08265 [Caulobacter sp. 73W]|uniref:Uncharacterized protein n=1 Tax=Caulobacter sp. 73W TaxID=3161137 RepID=A0AB39KXK4_9CAUL
MNLRQDLDQEIDQHDGAVDLVLLVPEDRWTALIAEPGIQSTDGDEAVYRGVKLKRAPVTAVIPGEGF